MVRWIGGKRGGEESAGNHQLTCYVYQSSGESLYEMEARCFARKAGAAAAAALGMASLFCCTCLFSFFRFVHCMLLQQ